MILLRQSLANNSRSLTGENRMYTYNDFLKEWHNDKEHIECHTSGSTGKPKLILLPKSEMARSAQRTIDYFNLDRNSHLHSCISAEYIGGKMMGVRADLSGARLSWETPSNRPSLGNKKDAIDLLAVVPSQMIHILENLDKLPDIRNVIIGGAPTPEPIRRQIRASGIRGFETYGMTETASHVALRDILDGNEFFRPLSGITISLDNRGCISISIEGWQELATNDIGELNEDGTFRVLGRYDNVIITGGKKVNPEEVERILEREFKCEMLIFSEKDLKWGEKVIVTFDQEIGYSDEEFIKKCKEILSDEMVPKEVRRGKIHHTPNGKKLRGLYSNS